MIKYKEIADAPTKEQSAYQSIRSITQGNKYSKKKNQTLTMESSVKTLALKIYDEQMPDGVEVVADEITRIDKTEYQVVMIKHYRDYQGDDFYAPSIEKPHYHILLRVVGRGKNGVSPRKVKTILRMLHIVFRPGVDDAIRERHGLETARHFENYITYLLHKTPEAIADGKAPYSIDEFITNLTIDEIQQVLDGYCRLTENRIRVGVREMSEIDEKAFDLGYSLKDFEEFYDSLPFSVRSHSKMKTVLESYMRGVEKRALEDDEVNRLCVFISGMKNTSKTYSCKHALDGTRILTIGGGGTGKFDNLRPSTEAIIVDDDILPNALNMTDNKMCRAYRRQKNNPWWCGNKVIVTSNLDFEDWLRTCGIGEKHFDAMRSRFYVCHVEKIDDVYQLLCDSVSTRGTIAEQKNRLARFIDFQKRYNEISAKYVPDDISVNYSDVLGWKFERQLKEEIEEEYKEEVLFLESAVREYAIASVKEIIDAKISENEVKERKKRLSERADIIRKNGLLFDLKKDSVGLPYLSYGLMKAR